MNDEPAEAEGPEEEFEIVEIDLTPYLTEEQKSWPVVRCESAEEEFAIEEPLPALDVRGPGGRLPALVGMLSELETALGGGGLDVARQTTDNGTTRATLLPRSVAGARERLELMARCAAVFGSDVAVTVV